MLEKDNEELREADERDAMKIKELSSTAEDYNVKKDPHKVAVIDSRPKNTKKESLAIERNTKSKKEFRQTYASKYKQSMKVCKNPQSGKIKTIFMPFAEVNKLRNKIDRLKQYRQDQKKLYQQSLAAYEKDKSIKNEEIKLRKIDFEKKYAQLAEVVSKRNALKEEICRNYFSERHRIKEVDSPSVDMYAQKLLADKQEFEKRLEEEQLRLEREVAFKVETIDKNTQDYINKYRNQVKRKEIKVNVLRDQFVHLQKIYEENLKTLKFELDSYLQREDAIEFRRQRENATFREDIIALKKRISDYEVYIKKLKDLVEKDQAEELIEELTKNDQKRTDLIEIRDEIKKLKDEVDNARRIKI